MSASKSNKTKIAPIEDLAREDQSATTDNVAPFPGSTAANITEESETAEVSQDIMAEAVAAQEEADPYGNLMAEAVENRGTSRTNGDIGRRCRITYWRRHVGCAAVPRDRDRRAPRRDRRLRSTSHASRPSRAYGVLDRDAFSKRGTCRGDLDDRPRHL